MIALNVAEVLNLFDYCLKRLRDRESQLIASEQDALEIIHMDHFKGQGAEAIKNIRRDINIPVFRALRGSAEDLIHAIEQMRERILAYEDPNGIVDGEYWAHLVPLWLNRFDQVMTESMDVFDRVVDDISDIMHYDKMDRSQLHQAIDDQRYDARRNFEELQALDDECVHILKRADAALSFAGTMVNKLTSWTSGGAITPAKIDKMRSYFSSQSERVKIQTTPPPKARLAAISLANSLSNPLMMIQLGAALWRSYRDSFVNGSTESRGVWLNFASLIGGKAIGALPHLDKYRSIHRGMIGFSMWERLDTLTMQDKAKAYDVFSGKFLQSGAVLNLMQEIAGQYKIKKGMLPSDLHASINTLNMPTNAMNSRYIVTKLNYGQTSRVNAINNTKSSVTRLRPHMKFYSPEGYVYMTDARGRIVHIQRIRNMEAFMRTQGRRMPKLKPNSRLRSLDGHRYMVDSKGTVSIAAMKGMARVRGTHVRVTPDGRVLYYDHPSTRFPSAWEALARNYQKYEDGIKEFASLGLDLAPFIGNAKALWEAVTGRDMITDSMLGGLERSTAALGIILGGAGKIPGKAAKYGVKAAKGAKEIPRVKYGDHFMRHGRRKVLKPNVEYVTPAGHLYKTDAHGRIKYVEGDLSLGSAKKNPYAQAQAGREDRLPDDDGGHLIASMFKGSGQLDNLVPMNRSLNQRGAYRNLEREWERALKEKPPKDVKVRIEPVYRGDSQRPVEFVVRHKIGNDDWVKTELPNT